MRLRHALLGLFVLPLLVFAAFAVFVTWLAMANIQPSVCRGDASRGSLANGHRLPLSGENYRAYSTLGFLAGRTFVHSAVRDTMRDAYAALARDHPDLRFIYAEGGWPWGGRFAPHKTHANGTAIDFHVPVRTPDGAIAELPASLFNRYGYDVEFDKTGRSATRTIDFDAMALHLVALEKAARANRIRIARVIFDVDLQPLLFASGDGRQLRKVMQFNSSQSWVRHDEHYHVDFAVPCE
jgi:penicillin-insensitive murein DD-endopeptidase